VNNCGDFGGLRIINSSILVNNFGGGGDGE
jgi:hypothetical protein